MSTPPPSPNRFRWALALTLPVIAVVVLVVGYRATAPERPSAGPGGDPDAPTEVLQVGALPVT